MRIEIQKVLINYLCCDIIAEVTDNDITIIEVVTHNDLVPLNLTALYHSKVWKDNISRGLLLQMIRNKYEALNV